ncbi:Integrin beta-PS, partial [Orchesella cincta]
NLNLEATRCFSNESLSQHCSSAENPIGTKKESSESEENENIKIRPQSVSLQLRKGEKMNITMQYMNERNRPVDMYIVMDLSCTMKTHKDKVAKLAQSLQENLRNLTNDLRIGFGSFVDKPLAPFGFLAPLQSNDIQCDNSTTGNSVQIPYGFKNHLRLTDDIHSFIDQVNSARISSNIDSPEGTLDGLLQSITCDSQIGWRSGKGTRKVVIISTDGSFHLAGDGKLVGVVQPHDGNCYVDTSGAYTHDTVLDYPSISLLRQRIKEKDFFVIFAVTKDQRSVYTELSRNLDPSFAVTQEIDNDKSIITVIEDEYKKLVNTVTMLSLKDPNIAEYVDIKFYVRCPGQKNYRAGNQCNDVSPGVNVSLKVEVLLKACPLNQDSWNSTLRIYPQSSKDESMIINLKTLCGCECEQDSVLQLNNSQKSSLCSSNGHLQCGICACDNKWRGPSCNCSIDESDAINKKPCVDPKTSSICNDKGICDSCGVCKCNEINGNPTYVLAKALTVDSAMKSRARDVVNVDVANVLKDLKGKDKDCRHLESPNKVCNGKGQCECGKCVCEAGYKGQSPVRNFCEIEHAGLAGSCKAATLRSTDKCIDCLVDAIYVTTTVDSKREQCKDQCDNIDLTFVERIGQLAVDEREHVCKITREDSKKCKIDFIIRGKNLITNKIILETEKDVLPEKCPTPPPIFEVIVGVVAAMVLIGVMLLLVWKIVTYLQDRREYERFEKSINDASWDTQQNPLYQPTTTQFNNPAYADSS